MQHERSDAACVVVAGKIYVIGGHDDQQAGDRAGEQQRACMATSRGGFSGQPSSAGGRDAAEGEYAGSGATATR